MAEDIKTEYRNIAIYFQQKRKEYLGRKAQIPVDGTIIPIVKQ